MLDKLVLVSKSLMFLALAFTFISTPIIINRQLTSLRKDATIQISALRTDTVKLVNTHADSLKEFTTLLFDKTNQRIGSIQNDLLVRTDTLTRLVDLSANNLNDQLTTFNTNLNNQETVLNTNIAQVTSTYAALPATIGSRINQQTDCNTNGLCWQNLTTDVLTNFRYTGRDISDVSKTFNAGFPGLMKDSNDITANVAAITGNFKRLTTPHWYDRVLGYALNGAILYRSLNPVTNLTLQGAQLISSRP
jgi:uncharacterized protein YoxC